MAKKKTAASRTVAAKDAQPTAALKPTSVEPSAAVTEVDATICSPCAPNAAVTEADEAFMKSACMSARAGVCISHGGPFGAAVVKDGLVLSCAHNTVLNSKDPTCHAEMNAIRHACVQLRSHDLSDCDLYTTCEPCPMCWGAIQWAHFNRVFIGVDRHTAAKYGFDDKVFYEEVDRQAEHYGGIAAEMKRTDGSTSRSMVTIYDGLCKTDVQALFRSAETNKTFRRRSGLFKEAFAGMFDHIGTPDQTPARFAATEDPIHRRGMQVAIDAAKQAAAAGLNKQREPFGAALIDCYTGAVVATGYNTVVADGDATATSEVNCIRKAAKALGSYDLSGLRLYATSEPDLMSMGAILWARIPEAFVGVSQKTAAQCGFEQGLFHYSELLNMPPEDRSIPVIDRVAFDACEEVFQRWSELNGKIY